MSAAKLNTMTPQQILDLPLDDNDSGANTIRGYLIALTSEVWQHGEGFSGKRPFGNSGWEWDLYPPLITNGLVNGKLHEDGYIEDVDDDAAHALIAEAIKALAETAQPTA